MVAPGRIELPTHGFSIRCSTDWATEPWRSWRESNPRSIPWQGSMLITTLQNHIIFRKKNILNIEYIYLMVAGVGFEPTTFRLWAWRANQAALSRDNGGRWGIRTPARIAPPFGFQDRSLQPGLGNLP